MFCRNCGNEIPEGASFCTSCGTKVEAAQTAQAAPVENQTTPVSQATPVSQDVPVSQAAPAYQAPQMSPEIQPGKKKVWVPIVVIAGILLVLTVLALFVLSIVRYVKQSSASVDRVTAVTDEKPERPSPRRQDKPDKLDKTAEAEPSEEPFDPDYYDPDSSPYEFFVEGEPLNYNLVDEDTYNALYESGSDYERINWESEFCIEGCPSLVFSLAPYESYGIEFVLLGVTNVSDVPLSVGGGVVALDEDGNEVGYSYLYVNCLSSGDTYAYTIGCFDGEFGGDIDFESLDVRESYYLDGIWECDWSCSYENNKMNIDMTMYNDSDYATTFNSVSTVLLDENGNVITVDIPYESATLDPSGSHDFSFSVSGDESALKKTKNIALFVNPYAEP